MKTAAEWTTIGQSECDALPMNTDLKAWGLMFTGRIQLDARAELLAELEQVKKERDELKRLAERMQTQLHCNCKFGNTCPKCELLAEFEL